MRRQARETREEEKDVIPEEGQGLWVDPTLRSVSGTEVCLEKNVLDS